jgi:hypothetical protein
MTSADANFRETLGVLINESNKISEQIEDSLKQERKNFENKQPTPDYIKGLGRLIKKYCTTMQTIEYLENVIDCYEKGYFYRLHSCGDIHLTLFNEDFIFKEEECDDNNVIMIYGGAKTIYQRFVEMEEEEEKDE